MKGDMEEKCEMPVVRKDKETLKEDFEWGNLTWFANKKLCNSDAMTVGRCILKPGRSNPRHMHPNCEEILTVIKGKIGHTLDSRNREVIMEMGDTITIPRGFYHQARNLGEEDAVLFIVFSSADRQTLGE